jgi:hypothetical protein
MSKTRIFLAFSIVAALLAPLQSVTAADIPDEQYSLWDSWSAEHPAGKNDKTFGVWFGDFGNQAVAQTSFLVAETTKGQRLCKSLEECSDEKDFYYVAFLPFCEDGSTTNCILDVNATSASGQAIKYSKRTYFPKVGAKEFLGNPKFQLPSGSTASVVEFPTLTNGAGTNTYSVGVYVIQRFSVTNWAQGTFTSTDPSILANIAAVQLVNGDYKARVTKQITDSYGRLNLDYMALGNNIECTVIEDGICGKPVAFPDNSSFALKLRLNAKTHGWMHGRLANAQISILGESANGVDVQISGSPSKIPSVLAETTIDKVTESIWATVVGGTIPANYGQPGGMSPFLQIVASNRGTFMMNTFKAMQPFMTDKAVAMPYIWSVRSVERSQVVIAAGQKSLDCLYANGGDKGKILGFINTNATAYVSGPPTFNEQTQSLDYSVAAPHFAKDGSVFKGHYSIQLDANTARCMFGLKGTNLKATLSILNDKGENNIITSVAKEDKGWFNFSVAGFTFSSPTIRLKLEEVAQPTITSSPSPTPAARKPAVALKKITCVKGKTVKTVSGVNPKCPSGFKKK